MGQPVLHQKSAFVLTDHWPLPDGPVPAPSSAALNFSKSLGQDFSNHREFHSSIFFLGRLSPLSPVQRSCSRCNPSDSQGGRLRYSLSSLDVIALPGPTKRLYRKQGTSELKAHRARRQNRSQRSSDYTHYGAHSRLHRNRVNLRSGFVPGEQEATKT